MALDVSTINAVHALLLNSLASSFSQISIYAKHLLYYFVSFEVILAGFAWMFYQNYVAERLFFQILKIGLIFFLVENYVDILNAILLSAFAVGKGFGQSGVQDLVLNPGLVWQYAYDFSVTLLKHAAVTEGFAFPMILMVLGFGILFVFGVFGIQILIQFVGFYLVGLMSLLLLPLSVFSPLRDFFSRSLQSVLQAAVRLMVLLLLVSAAVTIFSSVSGEVFSKEVTIDLPLGFFFTGLLFVMAAHYLPSMAEKVVGRIHWESAPLQGPGAATLASPSVSVSSPSVTSAATMAASVTSAEAARFQQSMGASGMSPASAGPQYFQAVKDDFLAQQKKVLAHSTASLQTMEKLLEKNQQEEIRRIKQAFYQVLNELKKE